MNSTAVSDYQFDNIMTLSGQGQVEATPDQAIIRLGVQTDGGSLADVQSDNARISQDILKALTDMGISDIRTFQYLVDRNYIYNNGNQVDNGFIVKNIFEIKTNDVNATGSIIDSAVQAGANTIDFVSFDVSNFDFYYQQALNLAVEDAIQKARSISSFLGHKTYPVPYRITEVSSSRPFSMPMDAFRDASPATPIEAGPYLIQAAVTIDFYS